MTTIASIDKWWEPIFCPLIFFLTGFIFLSYPGLQDDEALAASPLFRSADALYHLPLFKHEVPVMLMSYLGAFKTWLYFPVFLVCKPSYLSVRVPPLLLGSATVWMTFLFLQKTHGRGAAWIGSTLLATDSMFLLTSCFDWGPVAIQHFLSMAAILLVLQFHRQRRLTLLAAAAFCAGLALWDKALFTWLLGGLATASVIVFPRQLWLNIRDRGLWIKLCLAALAFLFGCSPLIVYNVNNGYPTFHAAPGFTTQELYSKSLVLRGTWDGEALFGYLVNQDETDHPRQPRTSLESLSFWLRSKVGERKHNGLDWALIAALLCLPLIWGTPAFRWALFCAIAVAVAWFQMGITKEAGGSAHHVVLLWPIPHLLIAFAFAEVARRWGKTGHRLAFLGTVCLVTMNLLVTNQYLYQFARNGSAGSWTDAIYSLADGLRNVHATNIAIADWGMVDPLEVLDQGKLPLVWASDGFRQEPPKQEARLLDTETLWVAYTAEMEQFHGVKAGIAKFAKMEGYQKILVASYYDRNGRPVFETFRLRKLGQEASPGIQ